MISTCLAFALAFSLSGVTHVDSTPAGAVWYSSLQAGGGSINSEPTLMMAPRLGVSSATARLQLSAPLFLRAGLGSEPGEEGASPWFNRWDDPETYASMLESLFLTSGSGEFILRIGTLRQELFGSGALLDSYGTTWDPIVKHTGMVAEFNRDGLFFYGLVNRIIAPNLVAMGGGVQPLRWLGDSDAKRVMLSAQFVVDTDAPAKGEREMITAGDIGARLVFHSGQFLQLEGLLDGVFLHGGRLGSHISLLMELAENSPLRGESVSVQLELIRGWEGYQPGYFDEFYDVERFGNAQTGRAAKADVNRGDASFLRLRVDGSVKGARFGVKALWDPVGEIGAVSYLRVVHQRWSATGMLRKVGMRGLGDLFSSNDQTFGELEVSALLNKDFYAFSHFVYGWHFEDAQTPERLSLWTIGLGAQAGGGVPDS